MEFYQLIVSFEQNALPCLDCVYKCNKTPTTITGNITLEEVFRGLVCFGWWNSFFECMKLESNFIDWSTTYALTKYEIHWRWLAKCCWFERLNGVSWCFSFAVGVESMDLLLTFFAWKLFGYLTGITGRNYWSCLRYCVV